METVGFEIPIQAVHAAEAAAIGENNLVFADGGLEWTVRHKISAFVSSILPEPSDLEASRIRDAWAQKPHVLPSNGRPLVLPSLDLSLLKSDIELSVHGVLSILDGEEMSLKSLQRLDSILRGVFPYGPKMSIIFLEGFSLKMAHAILGGTSTFKNAIYCQVDDAQLKFVSMDETKKIQNAVDLVWRRAARAGLYATKN